MAGLNDQLVPIGRAGSIQAGRRSPKEAAVRLDHSPHSPRFDMRVDGSALAVSGEIDMATAPDVRDAVARLLLGQCAPADVVLDLSDVSFVDSSGLPMIAVCAKRAAGHNSRLVLRSPSPFVVRLLRMTGADQLVRVDRDDNRRHPFADPTGWIP